MSKHWQKSGKVEERGKCSFPTDSDVFPINFWVIDRCEAGTEVSIYAPGNNYRITDSNSANLPWFNLSALSMCSSSFSESSAVGWYLAESVYVDMSGNVFKNIYLVIEQFEQ